MRKLVVIALAAVAARATNDDSRAAATVYQKDATPAVDARIQQLTLDVEVGYQCMGFSAAATTARSVAAATFAAVLALAAAATYARPASSTSFLARDVASRRACNTAIAAA